MVKEQYSSLAWQRGVMLPWMYETYPTIGDFYEPPTIVITGTSIQDRNHSKPFHHYNDIFNYSRQQRILLEGPPGYGKSVFTHKIAYDWSSGNLSQFDFVFLLKLRDIHAKHTIPIAIVRQFSLSDENISPKIIKQILLSKQYKTLLVLDGLDEIVIDNYKYIKKFVEGRTRLPVWLILSTRPHEMREDVSMTFH